MTCVQVVLPDGYCELLASRFRRRIWPTTTFPPTRDMRAAVYDRGCPEGIRVVTNRALPAPSRNALLVRVKACGVNPVDAKGVIGDKPSFSARIRAQARGRQDGGLRLVRRRRASAPRVRLRGRGRGVRRGPAVPRRARGAGLRPPGPGGEETREPDARASRGAGRAGHRRAAPRPARLRAGAARARARRERRRRASGRADRARGAPASSRACARRRTPPSSNRRRASARARVYGPRKLGAAPRDALIASLESMVARRERPFDLVIDTVTSHDERDACAYERRVRGARGGRAPRRGWENKKTKKPSPATT